MRMKRKIFVSLLLTLISTLTMFGKEGFDPVVETKFYELVVVPADTTMGDLFVELYPEGSRVLPESISNNRPGYEFDHWESVHGVDLNNVQMNDTIIVYFKKLQEIPITIISSDTTKGTVTATPIYYDYEKIYLSLVPKEGYKYAYWYNLKDTTKKNSGTTLYASANDTIVCIFLSSPEYAEDSTLGYNYCKIVALTSDSAKGTVKPIEELVGDGNMIPLSATPNRGYKFDHWESVRGYGVEYAFGNDTIYAYFDTVPSYNIVVVSSDTTMGSFYGDGLFYEGENLPVIVSTGDTYISIPIIKINDGYRLVYYESKNKGYVFNDIYDYTVSCNDTIVAYFEKDTIPNFGKDTLPTFDGDDTTSLNTNRELRFNIIKERQIDFYGNLIRNMFEEYDGGYNDSIIITNKTKSSTDTISIYDVYKLTLGDTISYFVKTDDEFKSDSVYTFVFSDSSVTYQYEYVYLNSQVGKIELEEAEGDSFNVNIVFRRDLYSSSYSTKHSWEGNGRYAKGDTINIVNDFVFLATNIEDDEVYLIPHEWKIVVNNDIDILLVSNENSFLVNVDQIVAKKETVDDPYVNVYTINGYLLKQHVLKEEALDGLSNGLYIVGGKKVYLRK